MACLPSDGRYATNSELFSGKDKPNESDIQVSRHQPETEFDGEVQEFTGRLYRRPIPVLKHVSARADPLIPTPMPTPRMTARAIEFGKKC